MLSNYRHLYPEESTFIKTKQELNVKVAYSPDGEHYFVAGKLGAIQKYRASDNTVVAATDLRGIITDMKVSNQYLIVSFSSQDFHYVNVHFANDLTLF